MRGKLLFVTGVAIGYVVGARAGRPAYDALTARFDDVTSSPRVREAGASVMAKIEDEAPAVAGALTSTVQTVTETAAAVQGAAAAARDEDAAHDEERAQPDPTAPTPPATPAGVERSGSRRVRSSGGAPAKADD